MMEWKDTAVLGGLGAFFGFLMAILLYEPLQKNWMIYLVYVGLLAGMVAGIRFQKQLPPFQASPYAFLLGIITSLLLVFLWVPGNAGPAALYLALGLTLGSMLFIKPSSFMDVAIVPLTYLGGFVLVILIFKDYPLLSEREFAIPILFSVAGSATSLAFFGSLARWGYEFARSLVGSRER
jgi:hypothetical protein